jgi:hypothetical protein
VVEGIDEVADGDPVPEGAVTEDAAPARG